MQDFKKLNVWQKAHLLAFEVYQVTESFPKEEVFGLTSQIRRASVSIPANLAEGCGRNGSADFSRFLQIALGSATELEYELLLAHDLKFLNDQSYGHLDNQLSEVRKMLISLIQKIKGQERERLV